MDNINNSVASKDLSEEPHNLKESLKKEFDSTISKAKTTSKDILESKKTGAADQLQSFANAAQQAAKSFDTQEDAAWVAPYFVQAADQIEQLSRTLKTKSISTIVNETANLARHNPTAFTVGSVILGVGIARFFSASSNREATHLSIENEKQYGKNSTDNIASRGNSFEPMPSMYANPAAEIDQLVGNTQVSSHTNPNLRSYDKNQATGSIRSELEIEKLADR